MALINPQAGVTSQVSIIPGKVPVNPLILPYVIVGEKSASGTASYGTMVENIVDGEEDVLFGADSEIAQAIKLRALMYPEAVVHVYVLPVDSGTKATATLAITGSPTEDGTIVIQGEIDNSKYLYQVNVTAGQTVNSIASAINSVINSATNKMFTSSVSTNTLTLTSTLNGKQGNFTPFKFSTVNSLNRNVAGLTKTYTKFSGGTTFANYATFCTEIAELNAIYASSGFFLSDATQRQNILDTFNVSRLNNQLGIITNGLLFTHFADSYANIQSLLTTLSAFDRPLLQYGYTVIDENSGGDLNSAYSGTSEVSLKVAFAKALASQLIIDPSTTIQNAFPQNLELIRDNRLYNLNVARSSLKYVYNKLPRTKVSNTEIELLKTYRGALWYSDGSNAVSTEWKTGASNAQYLYQSVLCAATAIQSRLHAINKSFASEKVSLSVAAKLKSEYQMIVKEFKSIGIEVLDANKDAKEFAIKDPTNPSKLNAGLEMYIISPLDKIVTIGLVYSIY